MSYLHGKNNHTALTCESHLHIIFFKHQKPILELKKCG